MDLTAWKPPGFGVPVDGGANRRGGRAHLAEPPVVEGEWYDILAGLVAAHGDANTIYPAGAGAGAPVIVTPVMDPDWVKGILI